MPFFLYTVGIVQCGNKKDLLYLVRHQVMEDIPVRILFVKEFLQQLPAADRGFLKLIDFLFGIHLAERFLQNLTGFKTVYCI